MSFPLQFSIAVFWAPWCVVALPFVILIAIRSVYHNFGPASRAFQRCTLLAQTPQVALFSDALAGRVTIRAFKRQSDYFIANNFSMDLQTRGRLFANGNIRWTTVRLQLLSFPIFAVNVPAPTVLLIALSRSGSMGTAGWGYVVNAMGWLTGAPFAACSEYAAAFQGLLISNSNMLADCVGSLMWTYCLIQRRMCSVERLEQCSTYSGLSSMASLRSSKQQRKDPMRRSTGVGHPSRICSSVGQRINVAQLQKHSGKHFQNASRKLIHFRDVSFRYSSALPTPEAIPSAQLALRSIEAVASFGERIGVVGHSGAGKSTLLLCLTGLLRPTSGAVILDNNNLADLTSAQLVSQLDFMPQFPCVLSGWTVRDVVDPQRQFSECAIWNALRAVGVASEIERHLSDGRRVRSLDEVVVSESSPEVPPPLPFPLSLSPPKSKLAVEQREWKPLTDQQLRQLCFARILLRSASGSTRLVLVDEPPLDTGSDRQGKGFAALSALLRLRSSHTTVVVVSHHIETLRSCNRLWVLQDGQLTADVETHPEMTQAELLRLVSASSGIADQ